jgi:hypothetical protein
VKHGAIRARARAAPFTSLELHSSRRRAASILPSLSCDETGPTGGPSPEAVPLTVVRLHEVLGTRRRLVFGQAENQRPADGDATALFLPGRLVAYLVDRRPRRALYVFRTGSGREATTWVAGVSVPVDLFFVAATARSVKKAVSAFRCLGRRCGPAGIDALSDSFWLRLADFIVARRGLRIVPFVRDLLRREGAGL